MLSSLIQLFHPFYALPKIITTEEKQNLHIVLCQRNTVDLGRTVYHDLLGTLTDVSTNGIRSLNNSF